jgi:hypothetical protein
MLGLPLIRHRHRHLLAAWIVTLALVGYGMLAASWTIVVAMFGAMVLAGATVKRCELVGELRYPWPYRAAVVILLGATGTVLAAAGSTVIVGDGHLAGFIALALTNLIAAIMAWRALVKPAPRRAAIAGLVVVIAELFAMIADIVINIGERDPGPSGTAIMIALLGSFVATWAGALVSIAALACFAPASMVTVPGARVVDDR